MTADQKDNSVTDAIEVEGKQIKRDRRRAVITQLFEEGWKPFLIALCWTIYRLYANPVHRNLADAIANFSTAFFLCSWAASQWFRVKKQQKVEAGLETIDARIERSIRNFDEKTSEIISNITGGDAFCYISLIHEAQTEFRGKVILFVEPAWSLHDLSFTVISRTIIAVPGAKDRFKVVVGEAKSRIGQWATADLNVEEGRHGSFYIDYYARNGTWRQYFIALWINNHRSIATKVERDGEILYEQIHGDFPRCPDGTVDWESDEPWVTHGLPQPAPYTPFDPLNFEQAVQPSS